MVTAGLNENDIRGKIILLAGIGAGTDINFLKLKPKFIVALDFSNYLISLSKIALIKINQYSSLWETYVIYLLKLRLSIMFSQEEWCIIQELLSWHIEIYGST